MSDISFERFIQLVEFDQATLKLEKEREKLAHELATLHAEEGQLSSKLQDADQRLRKAKLLVKEKEAHIEELSQREKNKEKQVDTVKNQREYASISAEIETLKKMQHDFEPELVEAWNQLDAVTREDKQVHTEVEQRQTELKKQLEEKNKALETIQATIQEREKGRIDFLEGTPPELMEKYNAMRTRVTNPIVPVVNNSCSACFNTVAQQILSRLRMRVLEQCRSCFRFLYLSDHR